MNDEAPPEARDITLHTRRSAPRTAVCTPVYKQVRDMQHAHVYVVKLAAPVLMVSIPLTLTPLMMP